MALSYSVDKVDEYGREMLTLKPKQVTSMRLFSALKLSLHQKILYGNLM